MDYSKANETLKMFGGDFQKMMECLSDWAEKMVKSDKEEKKGQTFENDDVEPDWNKFCRNYEVLLNRYNKKE